MAERTDSTGPKSEERRESPRVPMNFQVRRAGSEATFEVHPGDLSLGGCAFQSGGMQPGTQLELRFRLATGSDELQVHGEVLASSDAVATRVRFLDMPVEAELAIARHLDDLELAAPKS
jgi:PilZ domain